MSARHLIGDVSIIIHTSSNNNFQLGYRISPPQGRRFAASGKLTLQNTASKLVFDPCSEQIRYPLLSLYMKNVYLIDNIGENNV